MPPAICGVVTGRRPVPRRRHLSRPRSQPRPVRPSPLPWLVRPPPPLRPVRQPSALPPPPPELPAPHLVPGHHVLGIVQGLAAERHVRPGRAGAGRTGVSAPRQGHGPPPQNRFPHRTPPASARRDPTTGRPTRPICVPHFGRGQLAPWHYAPCAWPFRPALTAVPGRDRA